MQHLFQSWQPFASAVKAASHTLLLSDYDGTLTPIVSRPEEALLPQGIKEKLLALAEKPGFSVGIVSGRSLPEVKAMVGIEGLYYAGNHGFEIEGPGLDWINPIAKSAQTEMRQIAQQLSARLAGIEGVIIEDKGLTISVHYRLVQPDSEEVAAEVFHRITSPALARGRIKITTGKKVWEVRPPVDWDKGKAVQAIASELTRIGITDEQGLTVYLGDDTTDEDAFRVLHHPKGWGIFVGRKSQDSQADYFLNSPSEVETFLARLLELKQDGF